MLNPKERITIMLNEPEGAANLGYIARIMANTGYEKLMLTGCLTGREQAASKYAVNSSHILDSLIKADSFESLIADTDVIFGFSPRNVWDDGLSLPYSDFAATVNKEAMKGKSIGLLFGNEACGLNNRHLSVCRYRVALPTEKKCPSMNLAHAVLVALWELNKALNTSAQTIEYADYASTDERKILKKKLEDLIDVSGYIEHKSDIRIIEIIKAIDSKEWTKREMNLLTSFASKLLREINALKKI